MLQVSGYLPNIKVTNKPQSIPDLLASVEGDLALWPFSHSLNRCEVSEGSFSSISLSLRLRTWSTGAASELMIQLALEDGEERGREGSQSYHLCYGLT